MRKILTYIFIFTIHFGCSEKNEERNATIFFGAKPRSEKFTLTFSKTDKSLNYQYVHHIDTRKNILIRKITDSDSLFFAHEKYLKTNKEPFKNKKINDLEFDYYDLEKPIADGTGPILFNNEYGLLAIKNVLGPTIIFLDKKNDSLIKQIIHKLNE